MEPWNFMILLSLHSFQVIFQKTSSLKNLSPFWQLFNTYGIFAAAYVVRPLGGIVMAHFGDKLGAKKCLC